MRRGRYKYSTKRSFTISQSPLGKGFLVDGVISLEIRYDKTILSSDVAYEPVTMSEHWIHRHHSIAQAKAIMLETGRKVVYQDIAKDPVRKVTILSNPVKSPVIGLRSVPHMKVVFNGSRHSSIDVRELLEDLFPLDWQQLKLLYNEVAADFWWDDRKAIDLGLYVQRVRTDERFRTTRYLGGRRSTRRYSLYDKRQEMVDRKGIDPGHSIVRLEFRNSIPAKDRPSVEEWLAGTWVPDAFSTTIVCSTYEKWPGVNQKEWSFIRRHGLQKVINSEKVPTYRKAKIKQAAKDNLMLPLQAMVHSVLSMWSQQYQEKYHKGRFYTGRYSGDGTSGNQYTGKFITVS